jgi:hypothetical protein
MFQPINQLPIMLQAIFFSVALILKLSRSSAHSGGFFWGWGQILGIVVSGTDVIAFGVCQLAFYPVAIMALFVKDSRAYASEAVGGYFFLVVTYLPLSY